MDGFLKGVAKYMNETYGKDMANCTMVFPSRRAGVFFMRYLSQEVKDSCFAPEIITINELIQRYSKLHLADSLSLVFRLYKVYKEIMNVDETFDSFYSWGTTLLGDFDDIDKYLVNASHLFTNIEDLKRIEDQFAYLTEEQIEFLKKFWRSFEGKHQGQTQSHFLGIWNNLDKIYTTFRNNLLEEGIAYEGMIYREVANKIQAKTFRLQGEQQYIICGLNALNKCEENFYTYLKLKNKGQFFWDYDHYYLDNPYQEAGLFQRRNRVRFPQTDIPYSTNSFKKVEKNIEVLSIPSGVGQAQMISDFVKKHAGLNPPFDNTAIVLCDEEMLLPALGAMPKEIQKVNVTMGYPMKLTPAYSLLKNLIDLQREARKGSHKNSFYHKNVHAVLNHQLVTMIEEEAGQKVCQKIINQNKIYLTEVELGTNDLFSSIFRIPPTIQDLSDYFLVILRQMFEAFKEREGAEASYQSEFIFQLFKSIKRLGDIINNEGEKVFGENNFLTHDTFFRLMDQHLAQVSVPFEGHPLEGLQVMGILETRALDFKNVIMLSMNDGTMPKVSATNSYIPYNLRRAFGLPTMEEQNAMYGYYFYRLLQRTEGVRFVYNSKTEGMSSGEKSRYIYQLQAEFDPSIKEKSIGFEIGTVQPEEFIIEKDETIQESLNDFFSGKRKLSPSAFNTYLGCPMRFYFQYIAGVKEPEEVEEEVDARIFGTLFHDSMENLYKKFVGFEVSKQEFSLLQKDRKKIDAAITKSFKDNYFKDAKVEITGRNVLIFDMIRNYIDRVIDIDKKIAPFELVGLEDKFFTDIPIFNGTKSIRMGGAIDRYDRVNGALRIIDYKSGQAKYEFESIPSLFEVGEEKRNKAALQTMVYALAFCDNHKSEPIVKPGIYQLQEIFNKDFDPILTCKMSGGEVTFQKEAEAFKEELTQSLEELFHTDIPFQQVDDQKICDYCPYKQICHK